MVPKKVRCAFNSESKLLKKKFRLAMKYEMSDSDNVQEAILRLARQDAASAWNADLNPSQRAILRYLARANRFSRSPSHVADYLGTTRGTVSQSLKSLQQKGYVTERRSAQDRRIVSIHLTDSGQAAAADMSPMAQTLGQLAEQDRAALERILTDTLHHLSTRSNAPEFGPCHRCRHHRTRMDGPYCDLLSLPLRREETDQICHAQVSG